MASPPKSARVWIWSAAFALALLFSPLLAAAEAEEAEAAAAAEEEPAAAKPSHVLTLDHSNFDEEVSKHPFVVVEFYAPWCGHCNQLEPEYEKAAAELKSHDPPIVLAKVDANDEANKELAAKYEVQGFPTIKILKDHGKIVQEYKGPREADGIVDYLKKQSGPPSVEIKSADDAKNVIDEKKVFIVGVFPDFSGDEYKNFITVAEKLRSDYDFGHTLNAKFLPKGDSTVSRPVVRLLKPFDELFVDSDDFQVDALEKFIEASSLPLVTIFDSDPSNHPFVIKFFKSSNAKAMLFTNFSSETIEEFKSKYNELAKHYKGKEISFLLGSLDSSQGAFQYFGLKEEQAPLIIIQTTDGQKYLKANLQPAQLTSWLKDYMDGNVKPFKKSEPIPEVNDEPVKVVVADSINDLVTNSGKHVLLEFYAPWCGHCQKLAPILDEVAVSLQSDPDVVIAKMDATANDVPKEFEVQGYPTLYFQLPSGKRLPYEGDRTKEAIIDFIQKNKESAAQSEPVVESDSLKDEL